MSTAGLAVARLARARNTSHRRPSEAVNAGCSEVVTMDDPFLNYFALSLLLFGRGRAVLWDHRDS